LTRRSVAGGIVSGSILENSAKSKIFNLPKHYPVVKVRSLQTSRRSWRHPAFRWSVGSTQSWNTLIKGSTGPGLRAAYRAGDQGRVSRVRPELFVLCSFPFDAGGSGGGDEETRTPDPLLAKEMLYRLSYVPLRRRVVMVGVSGLEPETSALSGQCSNQLS
jgi:hypothetical protein